jgi:zinc protease
MLNLAFPTVPDFNKDRAALSCLAQILGQGRNSVLYQQMVKKRTAVQATAFSNLSELAGEFQFLLIPGPNKTLKDVEDGLKASLDSFEARGITDDDLVKFKAGYESQLINGFQSVSGKIIQLARFQFLTGNPNQLQPLLNAYMAITKEDVMRVYNQYIKNKPAVILSIVPKGQEAMIVHKDNYTIDTTHYERPDYGYQGLKYAKSKDNFDRSKMPGAIANPPIKVPKFWRKDLANGTRVIGTENTEIPVATLTITIPGGHLLQANDLSKVGLASMFAQMMNEDTKNHTAEQVAVELQKLGASINVSSGLDGIVFNVQLLKKNIDPVMALLKERMLNPKFTETSFNLLRSQRMEFFKLQKGQAPVVADKVMAKVNYGAGNILGMDMGGTEETISKLSLQDINDYYNNYMTSMDAKVVIVGDITEEEILPRLSFMNQLPKRKITLPKVDAAPEIAKTKVFLVDMPKAAQSEFRIGSTTGLKYDATGDYYKASLANYPLGGNFNSRVNMNLREDKAWTYGARSAFSGDDYSGEFEFETGIRSNASDSALVEVMKEIRRYVAEGPTDDDVAYLKNAVAQSDARRYETGFQKAIFIGRILDYNLPANYIEQQNKILKKITKEELHKVTQKYIKPEKLNILLVGDKAKIFEKIKKLGYEVVELDTDGKKVEERKAF